MFTHTQKNTHKHTHTVTRTHTLTHAHTSTHTATSGIYLFEDEARKKFGSVKLKLANASVSRVRKASGVCPCQMDTTGNNRTKRVNQTQTRTLYTHAHKTQRHLDLFSARTLARTYAYTQKHITQNTTSS